MTTITIVGVVAIVAISQYLLPRYGPSFLGSIIPVLFLAAAVVLLVNNGVSRIRDILLPLAGFFALLCIWGGALEAKTSKSHEEMERIDRQIR